MTTVTSRSGAISLRTTEQGLPLEVQIERPELRRDPMELANELLRLCKQARNRAGLAQRAELERAGMPSEMLALTGLPKPEDVAREELVAESEYETEPQSWLRSV